MDITSCSHIGHVIKKHGIKGELKVYLEILIPTTTTVLFIEQNAQLVPFFLETISLSDHVAIIKFEDVNTFEEASVLLKHSVFINKKDLPVDGIKTTTTLEEKSIIGYRVVHNKKILGTVQTILDNPLNPLLVIVHSEKELLIPVQHHFLKEIDEKKKEITVVLPDHFLDL